MWGTILAAVLIGFFCFWTVTLVGVRGGPLHGEQPLIAISVHLIAFLYFGRTWPRHAYRWYEAVLGVAFLLAAWEAFIPYDWDKRRNKFVLRGAFVLVYIGCLILLFTKP
jgi:hypothetical protein